MVVDAPSLLYRAFYALPKSITNDDGQPVNALLGSINLVLREIEEHEPRAVVMCFGQEAAKYRVELYDGYHADRPPMPDELTPQWEAAPGLYEALGWYTARSDEYEADDLLGSYAEVETDAGGDTLIFTGDRDMFQCVNDNVKVLYVRTGQRGAAVMDTAAVEEKYGIPPALVPDFIALRGDPSDGIPGAKGVGEKTAATLLKRYGSLEDAITGKLVPVRDQLLAFKDMATLRRIDVERPADREMDRPARVGGGAGRRDEQAGGAARLRARAGLIAIACLAVGYGMVMQSLGWAETSNYGLVRAMSDGRADIDPWHWETKDKSVRRGPLLLGEGTGAGVRDHAHLRRDRRGGRAPGGRRPGRERA